MPQMGKKAPQWTGAELKIAAEIKARGRGTTIKECQHLLPNRTLLAIKMCVARQPGGKKVRGRISWVWPAARKLLEEIPGLTNRELAESVGCTRNGMLEACNHARLMKELYVCGWSGNAPRFALGDMPDVPKPLPRSKERINSLDRAVRHGQRNPFGVAMNQVMAS